MKETKTEVRYFSVPDWQKEEAYLRRRHLEGWEFVRVSGVGCYHFRRCAPKDVVYQLDFNTASRTNSEEYVQMFRDCGWEYLQNYVGYSYFRKSADEMNGEEEKIFCDEESRIDMMKRVFETRMKPLLLIFLLIIIPQLFLLGHRGNAVGYGLFAAYVLLFFLYLALFISFAVKYRRFCRGSGKRE